VSEYYRLRGTNIGSTRTVAVWMAAARIMADGDDDGAGVGKCSYRLHQLMSEKTDGSRLLYR
jgi:hypothetical protein